MFKEPINGVFFMLTLIAAKEAELPLCPTNVLYFPQNLPMHCRMPTNADFRKFPGLLTNPQDKQVGPMPIPFPPGVPGPIPMPGPMPMPGQGPLPGGMPMPGPMPVPGPMPMPGPFPGPGPMPLPGPVPMPVPGGPSHKLPVIVMPFYSPDTSFKRPVQHQPLRPFKRRKFRIRHRRRRPYYHSSDTSSSTDTDTSSDTSSSSSSEYRGWWNGRKNQRTRRFNGLNKMRRTRNNKKRELLTPVIQYVTKDGYVIFEKKISNNEANDWLNVRKDEKTETNTRVSPELKDMESNERNNNSQEKEMVKEENVEVITKRSPHRQSKIKPHRNKAARQKFLERQS